MAHAAVPALGWAAAFTLGAIVAPTDALAATTVFRRLGAPRVIVTLIEGEALFNDATALVAYRAAVVAAVGGAFILSDAAGRVRDRGSRRRRDRRRRRAGRSGEILRRLDDPPVEVLISIVIPFAAYLPADRLGLSGVLAAVTAGLVIGSRLGTILTPSSRVLWLTSWKMIGFVLNGFVFVLIGLELPTILEGLGDRPPAEIVGLSALVCVVVVVTRIVWVFASSLLPESPTADHREARSAARAAADLRRQLGRAARRRFAGCGARAARWTSPSATSSCSSRSSVILVTLVGQGLTLPRVLRWAALGRHRTRWRRGDAGPRGRVPGRAGGGASAPASSGRRTQPLLDRLESGLRDRTQHLATEDPDETAERTPGARRARGDPARASSRPSGPPSSSSAIAARSTTRRCARSSASSTSRSCGWRADEAGISRGPSLALDLAPAAGAVVGDDLRGTSPAGPLVDRLASMDGDRAAGLVAVAGGDDAVRVRARGRRRTGRR